MRSTYWRIQFLVLPIRYTFEISEDISTRSPNTSLPAKSDVSTVGIPSSSDDAIGPPTAESPLVGNGQRQKQGGDTAGGELNSLENSEGGSARMEAGGIRAAGTLYLRISRRNRTPPI